MELKFEVYGKIGKPIVVVFNAVTDPNERIELDWEANEGGYDTHVVMTFEALMPCCHKAWVEHRINLREGFF